MRDPEVAMGWLAAAGVALSHMAVWLLYRARLRRLSERMAHRLAERDRRFSALHDSFLQDIQGLALSLQAVSDQLPADAPMKRQLDQVLDRTDGLLADGRRRVQHPGANGNGGA